MLTKDFFIRNREKLFNDLLPNSTLVLFSGKPKKKSEDENYPFQVNTNFYYECGIIEDGNILVLSNVNGVKNQTLYIVRQNEVQARWVGRRIAASEASLVSGINDILFVDEFNSSINYFLANAENVYLDVARLDFEEDDSEALKLSRKVKDSYPFINIIDAHDIISKHRMVKEKEEVELIKEAIRITKIGIDSLMKNAKTNIYEYELEAYFDFEIKRNGAEDFAFKTIAGSGVNGAVLHYSANNCLIEDDSLILFDLGAKYKLYNADITRTFPVNGKFTNRQKVIYDIVLRGQKLIIDSVKPGLTLRDLNDILINFYLVELKKIGLIKDDSELRKYYFHGVSHHLGLDTHDASIRSLPLVKGCVITVEPGLYLEEEKIGIRIENDVLVTDDGCIDLASDIIREIEDIENYMKK